MLSDDDSKDSLAYYLPLPIPKSNISVESRPSLWAGMFGPFFIEVYFLPSLYPTGYMQLFKKRT